jgi:hypothetical protein
VRADQRVDGDDRRGGARGAAAKSARERQSLDDRQRHAARFADQTQQRLGGNTGGVASRLAWQTSIVAGNIRDVHARGRPSRRDLIARFVQRKPEHIEPACDVRHGRRRKRSDRDHER